jgi:putative endonuclease
MSNWYVYILRCADDTLYTGVATDVERRVHEHNHNDRLGARYTRARRPVSLVYQEPQEDRSQANKREYEIKQLTRKQKESLIQSV